MATNPNPIRGEVWRIRFDPAEGDEIKKIRTAVVMSENAIGRLGELTPSELDDIANAIAICVGIPDGRFIMTDLSDRQHDAFDNPAKWPAAPATSASCAKPPISSGKTTTARGCAATGAS